MRSSVLEGYGFMTNLVIIINPHKDEILTPKKLCSFPNPRMRYGWYLLLQTSAFGFLMRTSPRRSRGHKKSSTATNSIDDNPALKSASALEVVKRLQSLGNTTIAAHSRTFFRTGPGQYGEGDEFLGIRVPVLRSQVKRTALSLPLATELLQSKWHEVRFFGVVALVQLYNTQPDKVYEAYLDNRHRINSWDLVDCSAPQVVGRHLLHRDRSVLYELADSESIWDRRIAVLTTLAFIRQSDFDDTIVLCMKLLHDDHDLIHKATGWMLREVGKRERGSLLSFLDANAATMPRTMLRYAIEHLPKPTRQIYLGAAKQQNTNRP